MSSYDATFLAIAPEFASVDLVRRTQILEVADMRVSKKAFGDRRNIAVAYLAAHLITVGNRSSGIAGAVTGMKEGDLSVSYGGGNSTDLNSTTYGQEYSRMVKENVFTGMVSN